MLDQVLFLSLHHNPRVNCGACHHLHFVGRPSQLYIKPLQQMGQSYRRLKECELVSHAFAWSSTKGKESKVCYNLVTEQLDKFLTGNSCIE
jgi:hypothetical protein